MDERALLVGVGALLCAACSLLGRGLEYMWGVDASRTLHASRALGAAYAGFALSLTPFALWMAAAAVETVGTLGAAALCAAMALAGGTLGFAVLFVSLRCEEDLSGVAGGELFPAAKKIYCAVSALACVLAAAMMLIALLQGGSVSGGAIFALSASVWLALCALTPALELRPRIRNEKQARHAAYGAAAVPAMLCVPAVSLLSGMTAHTHGSLWLIVLLWLWAWAVLTGFGGWALRGLFASGLPGKARWTDKLYAPLAALLSIALAFFGDARLLAAACAACVLLVLLSAVVCSVWLERIGRGLWRR